MNLDVISSKETKVLMEVCDILIKIKHSSEENTFLIFFYIFPSCFAYTID